MVWIRRDLKKNIQFQSQPWAGTSPKLTASSSLALSSSRLGASATSLGHLFQCLTSIMGKNVFLMSDLSQAPSSWKPLSLILSLQIPLQVSCKPQIAALRGNHGVASSPLICPVGLLAYFSPPPQQSLAQLTCFTDMSAMFGERQSYKNRPQNEQSKAFDLTQLPRIHSCRCSH